MKLDRFNSLVLRQVAVPTTITSCAALSFLAGCGLGPRYQVPAVATAPAYKEADASAWKTAEPNDTVMRGKWWEMFQDSQLNILEERVDAGNQNIAAAASRYVAARAIVRETRSQYLPSLATAPALTNARVAATPYAAAVKGTTYTEYSFPMTASWEPDLWGRIRKSVRVSAYTAQASAADLENVRLLAHADLAGDYFQLRGVEAQRLILDDTIAAWQSYLDLTRGLYKSGLDADEAVAAAESQLKVMQAQDAALSIARAQYEHAIAILIGESPSSFALSVTSQDVPLPKIPASVPAELIERRPDIAGAERTMAAANAQIGIAKAAYFPNIILSATDGLESLSFADWFTWPSRFWSVGPVVAETLFDAGLRKATVHQYQALYDASIADYRQTTLTAFQQVEDNLAALRLLGEHIQEQDAAVQSAHRYLSDAEVRNKAGLDPYLNVITAQLNLLTYQQTYVTLQTQQRIASVQLIEALGGGWDASQLPSTKQAGSDKPSTQSESKQ